MSPTPTHPYYVVWTGALNLGDTPGVFSDAAFVGLLLQIPVTIVSAPAGTDLLMYLKTSDVEIFQGKTHAVYWDWNAGDPLPAPVGSIDDVVYVPGMPEYHYITIPAAVAVAGKHTLTIVNNPDAGTGFRDDFVLKSIEVSEQFGAKIGW